MSGSKNGVHKNGYHSGGKGDSLLGDPNQLKSDIKLINRAIKLGWPVPAGIIDSLPKRLGDIAMNSEDERACIGAAGTIVKMIDQNIRLMEWDAKETRLDSDKPTDIVGQKVLQLEFDDRA